MSNAIFKSKIKKVLYHKLPKATEYGYSRRIEGALERDEYTTFHESGAIIVDNELNMIQFNELCESMYDFLSKDIFFKKTKYRTMVWKDSTFNVVHEHGASALCSVKNLKTDLDSINTSGSNSGDWENFFDLYKPHKKAGQVILITTQEKIDLLEQLSNIFVKNLVIIYMHTDDKERKTKIKNIPCISYENNEKER